MKTKIIFTLLGLGLLNCSVAHAAQVATDDFNYGMDGWTASNASEMPVTYDPSTGDMGLGSVEGTFATQSLAFVQTDSFVATNTTDSGDFTGAYPTNATSYTFDFMAGTVLPSDVYVRINGAGGTYFYNVGGQITGVDTWNAVTVPLSYGSGWVGGSGVGFSNTLASVNYVDVQITRDGTSQQSYWVDNFGISDQPLTVVPEPNSGVFALGGLMILTARRKIRRILVGRSPLTYASRHTPA